MMQHSSNSFSSFFIHSADGLFHQAINFTHRLNSAVKKELITNATITLPFMKGWIVVWCFSL
jgi:hypothetical protein